MISTKNERLRPYAQKLRREMTKEESHLWYDCLKLCKPVFKRQKVLGRYIVDFYCATLKLVIELDGSQHYEETGKAKDTERDVYLSSIGLTVFRFSNYEVNTNFDGVCTQIYNYIEDYKNGCQ